MFLSQLHMNYNFVALVNLVRAADHTVEVDSQWAALRVAQKFDFPASSRSQLPQPLGNPMFLPQLLAGYNFAAGSNLVRGACRMLFSPQEAPRQPPSRPAHDEFWSPNSIPELSWHSDSVRSTHGAKAARPRSCPPRLSRTIRQNSPRWTFCGRFFCVSKMRQNVHKKRPQMAPR